MKFLFWSALLGQGAALLVDEFYFHHHRDLPRWEKWGHPVDTFFFLLPLSVLSFQSPTEIWRKTYVFLAAFSCLIITKDEWVHRRLAPAMEQWLHSILFLLHPVVLISGFFLWKESFFPFMTWIWTGVFVFFIYQIVYWNFYADRIFKTRLRNYQ